MTPSEITQRAAMTLRACAEKLRAEAEHQTRGATAAYKVAHVYNMWARIAEDDANALEAIAATPTRKPRSPSLRSGTLISFGTNERAGANVARRAKP